MRTQKRVKEALRTETKGQSAHKKCLIKIVTLVNLMAIGYYQRSLRTGL